MTRDSIRDLMNVILARHGKAPVSNDTTPLREIGFRSLDFSELALRVERAAGRELNFDAALMRSINSVGDVLDFLEKAANA